jgi:predicted nucleic acid-binding Zn ribbon protein
LICGQTIPEKQARFRAKVCSPECRYAYRKWRQLPTSQRTVALHCQVCHGPIPLRANVSWAEVCSQNCRNEMRRYRFQILKTQKCPHCYHPSSPAERESWLLWRKSRGSDMQAFIREPHGRKIRTELRAAAALLTIFRDRILTQHGVSKMEALRQLEEMDVVEWDEEMKAAYRTDYELAKNTTKEIERWTALLTVPKAVQKKNVDTDGVE